jgi:hypothetical protein
MFPDGGWEDYVLAEEGTRIGALITDQKIIPGELAQVLYDRLNVNGQGSGGRLNELQTNFSSLRGDPR